MATTVVGIFKDHDAVSKLVDSMTAAGFGADRLKVVSGEAATHDLISSGVEFIFSGDAEEVTVGGGAGIITSMGGTGVPGLNETMPQVGAFHSSDNRSMDEVLSHLSVPGNRYDDYSSALYAGRTVAAYAADGDSDKVKEIFRTAGAFPVEVY